VPFLFGGNWIIMNSKLYRFGNYKGWVLLQVDIL